MDLICPVCGEPWDMDELHEIEGVPFARAYAQFRTRGCEVFDSRHNPEGNSAAASASAALMDLLGDDADGAAALLEDLGPDADDIEF